MMDFDHIWYDDRYGSKVLFSNTLPMLMISRSRSQTYIKGVFFKSSYFPNHTMDFVHIWYADRYRSEVLFRYNPCPCQWPPGQSQELLNFILKCFKSSYFPNYMIDLVHIWNDNRYRSKVLFIITLTHAYNLKVKVTDLESLYLILDNVKFMATNDQTIAQAILSRATMP